MWKENLWKILIEILIRRMKHNTKYRIYKVKCLNKKYELEDLLVRVLAYEP